MLSVQYQCQSLSEIIWIVPGIQCLLDIIQFREANAMLRYSDVQHLKNDFGQAWVNKFNYLLNKINEMLHQNVHPLMNK